MFGSGLPTLCPPTPPSCKGYVTTVHVTDEHLDGPPAKEWCLLSHLRELDLDGGNQCGPFPEWVVHCLPQLQELDLSFNRVRGGCEGVAMGEEWGGDGAAEGGDGRGTLPSCR